MSERKPLIAANLKMNGLPSSLKEYKGTDHVDIIIFPTFPDLQPCIDAGLFTGAQYGRPEDVGAFTGDVSMKMIKDLGCTYVLCGHSERRQYHHETNEDVAVQVVAALSHGLHPILCVGETAEERDAGREEKVVEQQLTTVLSRISTLTLTLTLAYEPVWAIGTGKTATPEDAQKMHSYIREILSNSQIPNSKSLRILYGGSMKPENAAELLAQPDIDGGLIGGASLDPKKFEEIVQIASQR